MADYNFGWLVRNTILVADFNLVADYNFSGRLQFWWQLTILVADYNLGDR